MTPTPQDPRGLTYRTKNFKQFSMLDDTPSTASDSTTPSGNERLVFVKDWHYEIKKNGELQTLARIYDQVAALREENEKLRLALSGKTNYDAVAADRSALRAKVEAEKLRHDEESACAKGIDNKKAKRHEWRSEQCDWFLGILDAQTENR